MRIIELMSLIILGLLWIAIITLYNIHYSEPFWYIVVIFLGLIDITIGLIAHYKNGGFPFIGI